MGQASACLVCCGQIPVGTKNDSYHSSTGAVTDAFDLPHLPLSQEVYCALRQLSTCIEGA